MEEERLVLLKEHKESQQKLNDVQSEKDEFSQKNAVLNKKVDIFQEELLELRDAVKESKEAMQKEQDKAAAIAEKANQRIQGRRPQSKAGASTSSIAVAKKPASLKFKQDGAVA